MKGNIIGLVVLGLAGGLGGPGCASYHDHGTGEGATYSFETLRARFDLDIGTVYAAARRAAGDLHLRIARAAADGISGEIRALDAQYDSVEIRLGALPGERTALAIRVTLFGDKNKSIVIFEQILDNLSEPQRAAAAAAVQWGTGPISPLSR